MSATYEYMNYGIAHREGTGATTHPFALFITIEDAEAALSALGSTDELEVVEL